MLQGDKLSSEQRHILENEDTFLTISSRALPGPGAAPNPVEDNESPSGESAAPLFETQVKLRLNQPVTLADLPEGIELNIAVNRVLSSSRSLCSQSGVYAVANVALILSAQTPQPLVIALEAQANSDLGACETTVIQGQVFDSENQPIAGAQIAVRSLSEDLPLNVETTTDAEGKYVLAGIYPLAQVEISARKPGYISQRREEVVETNKKGDPEANHFDFGGPQNPRTALQADAS